MTWVDRTRWGEKGADLGSDRGPWTEQLSFKPETPGFAEVMISK